MNTIGESELIDCVRNKAVKRMCIVQQPDGNYRILVNLSWKDGDHLLISTRKEPREWASLDRLEKHIRTKYGYIKTIILDLYYGEATHESGNSSPENDGERYG